MRALILFSLLISHVAAAPAMADVTTPSGKVQDCYCTDSTGGRIELGDVICLHVDGRMFLARCEMSLNNPMWREVQQGCTTSRLQSRQPAGDAGPVDAEIVPAKS